MSENNTFPLAQQVFDLKNEIEFLKKKLEVSKSTLSDLLESNVHLKADNEMLLIKAKEAYSLLEKMSENKKKQDQTEPQGEKLQSELENKAEEINTQETSSTN